MEKQSLLEVMNNAEEVTKRVSIMNLDSNNMPYFRTFYNVISNTLIKMPLFKEIPNKTEYNLRIYYNAIVFNSKSKERFRNHVDLNLPLNNLVIQLSIRYKIHMNPPEDKEPFYNFLIEELFSKKY